MPARAAHAGFALNVRIGIHTGSGRHVGARRTVPGPGPARSSAETPNLAARVQAAAPAGVRRDLGGRVRGSCTTAFGVRALGPQTLKGINRPIELYGAGGGGPARGADEGPGPRSRSAATPSGPRSNRPGSRRGERFLATRSSPAWARDRQVTPHAVQPGAWSRTAERMVILRCSALHANTPLYPIGAGAATEDAGGRPDGPAGAGSPERPRRRHSNETLYLLALATSTPWPEGRSGARPGNPSRRRERAFGLLCEWLGPPSRRAAGTDRRRGPPLG